MADARFEKHVYGRERKHSMKPLEEFDPRPPESIGTATVQLQEFLVLRLVGLKAFTSKSTDLGRQHESVALEWYVKQQQTCGNTGLLACKSGFVVSECHPFL